MQRIPQDTSKFCTFYIVRHGQTEWNVRRIIHGHKDAPLSPEGVQQIKEIAQTLKDKKFASAFSSDLLRAKRTADVIALEHKLAVESTQLLRERNYGEFDGKPIDALKTYEQYIDTLSSEERKTHIPFEGYETDESVVNRLITFFRETAIMHGGKNVLVVTHSGVMRVLLIHLGFATYKTLPPGTIKNTAYIQLLSDGVDFYVEKTVGIHPIK